MNKYVSGAYTVEIPYTGSKRFYFPEIPQLRNKRIKHIDYVSNLAPSGKTAIPNGGVYLNVIEANTGQQLIENLSTTQLRTLGERLFINKIFDLQRCYFEYKGTADLTNLSLVCVLWYDEPASWSMVNETNQRTKILPLQILLKSGKTYFSENQNFKNAQILNMFLFAGSYAPDGSPVITSAGNKFITLSYNNTEYISRLPLGLLNQSLDFFPLRFQGIKIDLQKSYIETLTTGANDLKTVFMNCVIDDSTK